MFGKLICWWTKKHKRGRRLLVTEVTFSEPGLAQYACPRCGSQWTRKIRASA
jgi:hypothetical protein